MDKDDIIKLAREAEGTPYVNRHYPGLTSFGFSETTLEAFANLVAASEREECAKLCDEARAARLAAQPEPVACRFCHSKKGCWTWQCYNCGEIDDVQQPAPPAAEQEPVAWTTMPEAADWDFVSGSKDPTGKLEGKWSPLYTAPPAAQREQEPTPWRDMVVATLVREGINKHRARELADHFAAQPEQEPWLLESTKTLAKTLAREFYPEVTQWECLDDLAGVILQIDNMATGLMRKTEQVDCPRCGHVCSQREWVGLTDDDRFEIAAEQHGWEDLLIAAEAKLKERNNG